MKPIPWRAFLLVLVCLMLQAAGCTAPLPTPIAPSLKDKAAAEATLILERAEATAILLRAQATAAVLVQMGHPTGAGTRTQPAAPPVAPTTLPVATGHAASADATQTPGAEASPAPPRLLGVTFAADGGMLIVHYMASPALARTWQPGNVMVIDEATGFKYSQVPVMPVIGPLIAHPVQEGQPGYVMFVNPPANLLQAGASVTVIFGEFKQEHVVVQ